MGAGLAVGVATWASFLYPRLIGIGAAVARRLKKSSRKKKTPKRVLRMPDLDYAKAAVSNTLGSPARKGDAGTDAGKTRFRLIMVVQNGNWTQ
jgi:hypothetical protein